MSEDKKLLTDEELENVTGGTYYNSPRGIHPQDDIRVNPEDSCPRGTCGSCIYYSDGMCTACLI